MKTHRTITLGLTLFLLATQSLASNSPRCEEIFHHAQDLGDKLNQETVAIVLDLAKVYVDLHSETSPSRQSQLQAIFDRTLPVIQARIGNRFEELFRQQLVVAKMAKEQETSAQDSSTPGTKNHLLKEKLLALTRIKTHQVQGKVFKVVDDHRLLFLKDGEIRVYDYRVERILHEYRSDDIYEHSAVLFSPVQEKVYFFTQKKMGIFDLNTGETNWQSLPARLMMRGFLPITESAISRDGQMIYLGCDSGDFIALDANDPQKVVYRDRNQYPVKALIESPDGKWVLAVRNYGADRLYRRDQKDFTEIARVGKNLGVVKNAFFTPDSRKIVFEIDDNGNYILDLASGAVAPIALPEFEGDKWFQITSDNQYLLSVNVRQSQPKLTVIDLNSLAPVSVGLESLPIGGASSLHYDGLTNTFYFWSHEKSPTNQIIQSTLVTVHFDGRGAEAQVMDPQTETRIVGTDPTNGHLFQTQIGTHQQLLERY